MLIASSSASKLVSTGGSEFIAELSLMIVDLGARLGGGYGLLQLGDALAQGVRSTARLLGE